MTHTVVPYRCLLLLLIGSMALLAACDEETQQDPITTPDTGAQEDVGTEDPDTSQEDMNAEADIPEEDTPAWANATAQVSDWQTCSLSSGSLAECAIVTVPLNWDEPEGETIELSIKRVGPGVSGSELWWFAGGPGVTVALYEPVVSALIREARQTRIYMLEPRGVGSSNGVVCSAFPTSSFNQVVGIPTSEWGDCIEEVQENYGDKMEDLFHIRWKAMDYAKTIEALRDNAVPAVAYGASAGGFTINTMLLDHPAVVDAVVMRGSPLGADANPLSNEDSFESVFQAFLQRCADIPDCAERFDKGPQDAADELLTQLNEGELCQELQDIGLNKLLFGGILTGMTGFDGIREGSPAVVYRALRCAPQDVAAFETAIMYGTFVTEQSGGNVAYTAETMASRVPEDWNPIQNWVDQGSTRLTGSGTSRKIGQLSEIWPWTIGSPERPLATYDMPLMIIHGELDPRAPIAGARALAEHATGKTYLVEVPDGVHSAVGRTVTVDNQPCGLSIFAQFIQDPETEPDTTCLGNLPMVDMEVDDSFAWRELFGTTDQWGDEE